MTQEHDFKNVIRARMAKTGERYATARAMLVAGRQRVSRCDQGICRSDCNKRCARCGEFYCQVPDVSPDYFHHPINYPQGSAQYCLACWLGVGPMDVAASAEGETRPSD